MKEESEGEFWRKELLINFIVTLRRSLKTQREKICELFLRENSQKTRCQLEEKNIILWNSINICWTI